MKSTQFKEELKKLEIKDLVFKLDALRREYFTLRLNSSTSHVKDYSEFKKSRKNIARALTVLRQKGVK
jgi:large subunit ribosomal protein L29